MPDRSGELGRLIRLPQRTRLVLAVSFCVLLSAGVLAVILAPDRPADDGLPVINGLPASAVGYSALAALLRAQNIPVTYAPIDEGNLHHRRGLVIIAPVSPRIAFPVPNRHVSAHILYVPPKWRLRRDPHNPDWVRSPGVLTDALVLRGFNLNIRSSIFFHMSQGAEIHWWIDPRSGLPGLPEPGPVTRLRSFAAMPARGMLGVSKEHMVLLGSGPFLLLSDPDFLDNLGMADQRTAMMAVRLIDELRLNGPVWIAPSFIVTLSGGRARPLSLIFRSPFLAATVCMIVAAILMAWQGLVRFGPLRPATQAFTSGKSGLIESAAGLIERTRRTQRMSPSYAALMRDLALATSRTPDPDRLLRQMQTKHRTTDDFFRLEQRAQAVSTQPDLLDVARALRLWKQEMTHGRK